MNRFFLFIVLLLAGHAETNAQVKIASAAGSAHTSSVLELESTSRGFLLPRLSTAQIANIANPAEGLMVYNTTTGSVCTYAAGNWVELSKITTPAAAANGSTFTTPHGSASTAFSTNSTCASKLISAGYTVTSCYGSLTVGTNTYDRVLINGQCWMKQNLQEVPSNFSPSPGFSNNTLNGSHGFYNNAGSEWFFGAGRLYQFTAAMNSNSPTERGQGACPTGWHVPSDCEWMYLEHGLGMTVTDQTTINNVLSNTFRSSGNAGDKIAINGSNSTGFTAGFAGYRDGSNGGFLTGFSGASDCYFWTSTVVVASSTATRRGIRSGNAGIQRLNWLQNSPISVRCLAD